MKLRIFIAIIAGSLMFACSSDDGDSGSNSIVGTWDLISLQIDGSTPEEEAVEQLISLLAVQDCYLLTMLFEQDGTATLESSLSYLDATALLGGSLSVDCPTESDTESATYTYENGQLTVTDSEGFATTIDVVLSGDRITIDLEGSEFEDIGATGSMTFERR